MDFQTIPGPRCTASIQKPGASGWERRGGDGVKAENVLSIRPPTNPPRKRGKVVL